MSDRKQLCVYTHSANGKIFYVGQGSERRAREKTSRKRLWLKHVSVIKGYAVSIHTRTEDRSEAERIEAELIAAHAPKCNILTTENRKFYHPKLNPRNFALSLKIKRNVRDAIAEAAVADGRSSSALVEMVMSEWLKG